MCLFVMSEQQDGFPAFPPIETSGKGLVCRGNAPPALGPIFPGCYDSYKVPRKLASQWKVTISFNRRYIFKS